MSKGQNQERVLVNKDILYLFLTPKIMLKRKNWFLCLILNILTFGLFTFYIGKKLDVYESDAWYSIWYVWLIGFIGGIFPALVMFLIFYIQIGIKVSEKLHVPLEGFYVYPYVWILGLIIPFLGWSIFVLLIIYVHIWYVIYLKRGYGEEYI